VQTHYGYHHIFSVLIMLAIGCLLYASFRLPETRPTTVKLASWAQQRAVFQRLLRDPVVWVYGLLISGINGILFSYYAEAPFIFETHFGFSALAYGRLGLVIAAASLLGAVLVNWAVGHWSPVTVALFGLGVSCFAALGLVLAALANHPVGMMLGIFATFLGLNIALPTALNRALIGYEAVMGSASGWFSLGYYLGISALTYLMSRLHSGSILVLPLYLLGICVVLFQAYTWLYRHPTAP